VLRARQVIHRLGRPNRPAAARALAYAVLALSCGAVLRSGRAAALDGYEFMRAYRTSSVSNGLPWEGRLTHAVRLHPSPVLRTVTEYAAHGNFYGTSELVSLIERSARAIAIRWPGSQLSVGELSAARGGKLEGHHSHRSGRDADIAFFMNDDGGRASQFRRFVTFDGNGIAQHTPRRFYFDDSKNWALVSTLLRDQAAHVQYIFVANRIRTRLLMEGHRKGESDEFLRAAAAVMVEPEEGHKHGNHFHVRIYCPLDDRPECQDSAPYWPWYDGNPPDGHRDELPMIRWRVPPAAAQPARAQRSGATI
jgi:penicillin-insensitive murein DD-endopeptidase